MSATIEEVGSDHSDHEHDHEHGHEHGHDHHDHSHAGHAHGQDQGLDNANLEKIQSRSERKARKALQGLGLKKVEGINRVVLRKKPNQLIVVATPDVYKSPGGDCYIVFGEAKVEDSNQGFASQLAQQQAPPVQPNADEDDDDVPALETVDDDETVVDETGIDPREIEMVMSQVNCSRAKAVRVLKENDGDVVNAIMAASQ